MKIFTFYFSFFFDLSVSLTVSNSRRKLIQEFPIAEILRCDVIRRGLATLRKSRRPPPPVFLPAERAAALPTCDE